MLFKKIFIFIHLFFSLKSSATPMLPWDPLDIIVQQIDEEVMQEALDIPDQIYFQNLNPSTIEFDCSTELFFPNPDISHHTPTDDELREFLLDIFPKNSSKTTKPASKPIKQTVQKNKIYKSKQSHKIYSFKNMYIKPQLNFNLLKELQDVILEKCYLRSFVRAKLSQNFGVSESSITYWCKKFKHDFDDSGLSKSILNFTKLDIRLLSQIHTSNFYWLNDVLNSNDLLTDEDISNFVENAKIKSTLFRSWYEEKITEIIVPRILCNSVSTSR